MPRRILSHLSPRHRGGLISLVSLAAAAMAMLTTASASAQTVTLTQSGISRNIKLRGQDLNPNWISYADCLADNAQIFFPVSLVGFTSSTSLEVWAGDGSADCTDAAVRGNISQTNCWKVYVLATIVQNPPPIGIKIRDIATAKKDAGTGTIEDCDLDPKQSADGPVPITLYFMPIVGSAYTGTGVTYTGTKLDMKAPLAPSGVDLGVGETLLKVSWNQSASPDITGYQFFCDKDGSSSVNQIDGGVPVTTPPTCDNDAGVSGTAGTTSAGGASGTGGTAGTGGAAGTDGTAGAAGTIAKAAPTPAGGAAGTGGTAGTDAGGGTAGAGGTSTTTCVPGTQISCACPGGTVGVQVCAQTGTGFEPCECGTGGDSGAAGASGATGASGASVTGGVSGTAGASATSGASGTAGSSGSCAASNCPTTNLIQGTRAEAKYACGSTSGLTSLEGNITGLDNFTTYSVAVAAVDGVGNVGKLSNIACKQPQPIDDFYKLYREDGGKAGGGYCNAGPIGATRDSALFGAFVSLGLALLVHRRGRR